MSTPPAQLCECFWAPGFAGETSSAQSSWHALSAVAFDDAVVSLGGVFRFGTLALDLHLSLDASRSGWGARLLDRLVSAV